MVEVRLEPSSSFPITDEESGVPVSGRARKEYRSHFPQGWPAHQFLSLGPQEGGEKQRVEILSQGADGVLVTEFPHMTPWPCERPGGLGVSEC